MKTYNNLYSSFTTFGNLLSAARKAQRGKRKEPAVARFNVELEKEQLDEHFKYAEYNTSPFEIDLTELIKGDEEKLSRYYAMEEFIAFTETFSE